MKKKKWTSSALEKWKREVREWTHQSIVAAGQAASDLSRTIWLSDPQAVRGKGTLQLRANPDGVHRWYWRYSLPSRKSARISLGIFGLGNGELTLKSARRAADEKEALYQNEESRDVRAFEAATKRAALDVDTRAESDMSTLRECELVLKHDSVATLLADYVSQLRRNGKEGSAYDAENMFKNHVSAAFPEYAVLPAGNLTSEHAVNIIRRLVDMGNKTTARKLRSYMRAAFAMVLKSKFNPNTPQLTARFIVSHNPIVPVVTVAGGTNAGKRVLSESELRQYMDWLDERDELTRKALRLTLFLAGQRVTQVLRTKLSDINLGEQTILIRDGKGRRKEPRDHLVPYGEHGKKIVEQLVARCKKSKLENLFAVNAEKCMNVSEMSKTVRRAFLEISAIADSQKTDKIKHFRMGDIRRTCETLLAPFVSKDIRAQLESHGISGVQAIHYDQYEYLEEKRAAIKAWEAKLLSIKDELNIITRVEKSNKNSTHHRAKR